ncbi:MAG: TonB-dependent receptor domain-containing protein [Luteibaculum sp.]
MKNLYIALITIFLGQVMLAQQNYEPLKKGSLKGTIVDSETGVGVEFATISLHSVQDSSLITGTTAGQGGNFELDNLQVGKYFLRIGFVGYKTKVVPNVRISPDQMELELESIALENTMEQLAAVEVSAEKRQMETFIDKKVFNVDKTPAAAGGDGLEVLRNVPSVEVDVDGNISLRGESNVNILVDGRPLNMSASQYLQSVPAASIEKIELITNPSAKYDPEGTSGIINIIMKKDRAGGFNGNLNSSIGYGRYPKTNNSLALNYRTGKWNFQSSLSANYNESWYGGDNERKVALSDTSFFQTTADEGVNENMNLSGKIGVDYFLSDKTTLYVSGTGMTMTGEGDRVMSYENYNANRQLVSSSARDAFSEYPFNSYGLNTGFQHKFNKEGHNLDLDVNYNVNDQSNEELFTQSFIDTTGEQFGSLTEQVQNSSEYNATFNSRLDYTLPVSDSLIMEAGFHTTFRDFDNEIFLANQINGALVADSNVNNRFLYNENVIALYNTWSREFKKWSFKAGLRYEYTGIRGELVNTKESNETEYHSLFPSAYLSYKFTPVKSLTLSYTRRINRPSEGQLNPFTSYSDPYTIRTGNPFLQPEYIDVMELGYNSYGKKINVTGSVYGRVVNNQIGRFLQLDSSGTNVVLFRNFDKSYVTGAELILNYNPFSWWRTTTSFNFWNSIFDENSFVESNLNYSNYGYFLFFQSMHNLKNDWMLQWNIQYRGRMQVLQGEITPMFGMDLSARKMIWDKKASISVRVSDIFNTRQFGFKSKDLGAYSYQTDRNWESQTIYLSFSYNFGKQDNSMRRNRRNSDFGNSGGGGMQGPGL